MTLSIVDFLNARLADDEAVARAAIDPDRPGTHWQWVTSETDTVVAHGDLDEAQEHQAVSLRSVEEFDTLSVGSLPAFLIHHTEEVHAGAGEHIARHDPARVLREVGAKRAIAREHGPSGKHTTAWEWPELGRWCPECAAEPCRQLDACPICGDDDGCRTVRLLAAVYSDHPDYREEWAV